MHPSSGRGCARRARTQNILHSRDRRIARLAFAGDGWPKEGTPLFRLLRRGPRGLVVKSKDIQRKANEMLVRRELTLNEKRVVVSLPGRSFALAVAATQRTARLVIQVRANECGSFLRQLQRLRSELRIGMVDLIGLGEPRYLCIRSASQSRYAAILADHETVPTCQDLVIEVRAGTVLLAVLAQCSRALPQGYFHLLSCLAKLLRGLHCRVGREENVLNRRMSTSAGR